MNKDCRRTRKLQDVKKEDAFISGIQIGSSSIIYCVSSYNNSVCGFTPNRVRHLYGKKDELSI